VIRAATLATAVLAAALGKQPPSRGPGLTGAAGLARAYDAVLDADLDYPHRERASICGVAPPEACLVLDAVALWWTIALEPESRALDATFTRVAERAVAATEAWTDREPQRAEAWFYRGAARGVQAQWRVQREERLAAARDGAKAKEALQRTLALDPALDDARFGLGMYHYYADVAPAAFRWVRWLLALPGGDRDAGLAEITSARERGQILRGEADYQLHLIYLWYEKRPQDALAIVRDLCARYPGNPLFAHREAEILDVYFHDATGSLDATTALLARAAAGDVREPALAATRARLNMARQLDRLGRTSEAVTLLTDLIAERPTRPADAAARAAALRARLIARRR
jgi:tetratricopeptide (TPR) repeat protein